ncbi:MAG: MoaD/ThiS family protein [Fimbriimonadales bacterium]
MIRIKLPYHLRNLARCDAEVELEVEGTVTVSSVLDALELRFPMLKGTIRDHVTKVRRPFLRFFVCGEDVSNEPTDVELPAAIADGSEPLHVIGAIAGG